MVLLKQSALRVEPLEDRCLLSANVVLEWNQLALHAVGQARLSPVFVSRDLAITQAAVYDAVAAIDRSFEPYHAHVKASRGASLEAAAAQAAHDTLTALFPTQASTFDSALAADLAGIPPGRARQGTEVGSEVARQILDWRSTDGSVPDPNAPPYVPGTDPGDWRPTPPAFLPALAPQWPQVTPFALTSGAQFRPDAPPALDSAAYAAAFDEVKDLGRADSTTRTDEQTQIAKFWNDGLGTAFAMGYWNRIAQQVATDQGLSLVQDARLFALLNIAEADAIISCWDAKYTYNLWRPVTAIQAADTDGNPDTGADAGWTPLLVTPNFPSYTSAHSTVSGAAAGVLTALFGADHHFTVSADGLPGVTRSFDSFGAAAAEAGQSRIYGGIHYQFDNVAGQQLGHSVADYVVGGFLRPRDDDGDDQLRTAAPAPAPVNASLRAGQVPPLLAEALARWQAAGVITTALQGINVRIADLGGLTLGQASGGVIWLDDNAAGWGWFVDPTPRNDSEFTTPGNQGEQGRMDLLTVLEHEIGHLLGRGHEAEGVMQATLSAGRRRTVAPTPAQDAGWFGAAQALVAGDADAPGIDQGSASRHGKR
jgi:membrane-associated phospholipid phosphatase